MNNKFIIQFIEVFVFFLIVLGSVYLLVVKLGAKITGRDKKDLKNLLLAAVIGIILMMLFFDTIT